MSRSTGPNYSWRSINWERPTQAAWSINRGTRVLGPGTHSSSAVTVRTGAYRSPLTAFSIGDERATMQGLNDRLASYLETVRNLEQANNNLELQIQEALNKRGPEVKDYSRYSGILEDLHKEILEMISGNENLAVRICNLNSAAEDFQMKMEVEQKLQQSVESDIVGCRNVLDNNNITRMRLENDIEALTEEMIVLKKNHEEEVLGLRIQIDQSGVRVDVDSGPPGEDLGQILKEIGARFEKMALENQEELKACHDLKVAEVEAAVAENTTALQEAQTERKEKHRLIRSLETDLQSLGSQTALQEGSLQDTELRYNMEMQKYNDIILQLEAELTELRANIKWHTLDYEALLDLKMKLEAEIATYRRLLDGDDFKLEDALE